jgi:hypothetical protein
MGENWRTTYRISEAARELAISAEWLKVGRGGVSERSLVFLRGWGDCLFSFSTP